MLVHKKIGTKERLLEMFEKVNKTKVVEHKEDDKPVLKEGYTEFGHKIKKSRIDEANDLEARPGASYDDDGTQIDLPK